MKYKEKIERMSLYEKAAFCSGADFWHLQHSEMLDIPEIMVTDGPHGLRKQKTHKEKGDILGSEPAVCFPTAVTTSCSWDTELLREMGEALGEECRAEKVSVLLGPGVNMKRSPLCGRNFEYFSEDPFLAGKLAATFINGVQSKGIGTSLKHFAANSQETRRMIINTVADERALREIYLPAFETAVKEAQPWTVMNAYNRLNGKYCAENKWLLTDVLRNEWGFEGLVETDWGAENEIVDGLKAGQSLEMPSSNGIGPEKLVKAVENGELDESVIDEHVDRILDLINKAAQTLGEYQYDEEEHHALAKKAAAQSMVLLKNEDNILPLKKTQRIAVIGEMAKSPRYQGAGSSLVNSTRIDNAFSCFIEDGDSIVYSAGYNKKSDVTDVRLLKDAVGIAKSCDVAVIFAGLTEEYEAEGYDRKHINLPKNHIELIEAVSRANPNTVVVLAGGAPVAMPWLGKVKAVLHSLLGGQAGAAAVVDILTGKVCPSGKLTETYAFTLEDNPSYFNFPGSPVSVEYRESIYIGYRYYDKAQKEVLFPFGYGLSYTSFAYSALKLSKKKIKDTEKLTVSFKIKNIGETAGAEIAQVYVCDKESTVFRPEKELKGFVKVYLEPGEEKNISVELDKRSFAFYNTAIHDWYVESGDFDILVGASSRDIKLTGKVNVTSSLPGAQIPDYRENAPVYYTGDVQKVPDEQFEAVLGHAIPPSQRGANEPLDINCALGDAAGTRGGDKVIGIVNAVFEKIFKDDPNGNMMKAMALEIPIRCFISMSAGVFTPEMAKGLLMILNTGESSAKGTLKLVTGLVGTLKNISRLTGSI